MTFRKSIVWFLVYALSVVPRGAAADLPRVVTRSLSVDEVVERTLSTNFGLDASAERLHEAEAQRDQTRSSQLPRLTALGRYTRLSPASSSDLGSVLIAPEGGAGPLPANAPLARVPLRFNMLDERWTFGGTLGIPLSDHLLRYRHERRAAAQGVRAAELASSSLRVSLAADARVAYYQWARATLRAKVAEQGLSQSQAHLHDVELRAAVGTATRADVLRVESELARAELTRLREDQRVFVAEARLRSLMHEPGDAQYTLEDERLGETSPERETTSLERLVSEARAQRAELRQQTATARGYEAQASAARAQTLPRLDLIGNMQYESPSSRSFPQSDAFALTWDASVQVSWAFSEIPGALAAGRAANARARAVQATRANQADAVLLEVTEAHSALLESAAALETSERGLRAAEESYRVRQSLFQGGAATNVELLDAELEVSRARFAAIDARIDGQIARVLLSRALGRE